MLDSEIMALDYSPQFFFQNNDSEVFRYLFLDAFTIQIRFLFPGFCFWVSILISSLNILFWLEMIYRNWLAYLY